ncbi:phosphopantetheine-binding protein [Sorangium sp. So ce1389]|uniref:phosphopantetheine-binding protein n=1 Tax=Sorangium sp. So ce1389 TaxID=3133336 RepID=UPI003F5F20FA
MDRQEVLSVVLKHLRLNVNGLEGREIDPSKSMVEFGASSLDIVEVVSASMRELQIRVPRTELAPLRNMDELVDLFTKIKNKTQ